MQQWLWRLTGIFGLGLVVYVIGIIYTNQRILGLILTAAQGVLLWGACWLAAIAAVIGLPSIWLGRRWALAASAAVVLAAVVAIALLRIDSFDGNLIPQFAWRWQPQKSELTREYFQQHQPQPPQTAATTASTAPKLLAGPTDFTGFRGSNRLAVILGPELSRNWSPPPRELWRHPVGLGWAGVTIVANRVFTQEQRDDQEVIASYDLQTGQPLWTVGNRVSFHPSHGDGPRATPTFHNGRLFSVGATGVLTCLDAETGQRIWQKELLSDPKLQNLNWGMAGSPLVVDDVVFVSPGISTGRSLVAFQAATGEEVWAAGDQPTAYASLQQTELHGEPQLLYFHGHGLSGHDPKSGAELWTFPWITQAESMVNVAQPLVLSEYTPGLEPNQILISSGYNMGCALLAVEKTGDAWSVREVWRNRNIEAKFSNMVVHDQHLYGFDNGIFVCLEVTTGNRTWKKGRYGHGQLLLVNDLLVVMTETGDVVLVETNPERLVEVARFKALEGKTWNHFALAGQILVVRNDVEMAAFELPSAAAPAK